MTSPAGAAGHGEGQGGYDQGRVSFHIDGSGSIATLQRGYAQRVQWLEHTAHTSQFNKNEHNHLNHSRESKGG